MSQKIITSIILLLIIVSAIFFTFTRPKTTSSITEVKTLPPRAVYLGAWVQGFWDNTTRTLDTSPLTKFEGLIDKKMAIANIYADWTYLPSSDLIISLNDISDNGWVPMISSNPSFFDDCPKTYESLYKTIASGECDEFLKSIAKNLRSYQKPILLRFAWEMNLPDMYWSIPKVNSTPEEFTEAWRHFHSVIKDEKADNVKWVLSFNTSSSKTIPYADLYPGHEYVDWVAIDGYNWGDTQDWSGWTSFNGVFRNSYNELIAVSPKPVMLSEVNSATSGGDKAAWLKDMLEVQIPNEFPQIEAIVFFNENKTEGESVDWRMEISSDYLIALKEGLKNELYKSDYSTN
jgi:mannan endo-1,4-beta-mannosidase